MNHSDVRELMPDYLEGDLTLDRRALFDAHLDECRECAREIAELRWTVGALRSLPDPEPPPMLVPDVMRRIRLGDGRPGPIERLGEWVQAALAPRVLAPVSVAAIAAGILLGTQPLRDATSGPGRSIAETPPGAFQVAGAATGRGPSMAETPVRTGTSTRTAGEELAAREAGPPRTATPGPVARTPGQELIAMSELLSERSRRTPFDDWSPTGGLATAGGVAPTVTVANRPGVAAPGDSMLGDAPARSYLPRRTVPAQERWPSADEWLAHVEQKPVQFADQMIGRTLAEREHWVDSLARRAVETERLDRVVAALRNSRSRTAHVLADNFEAAGAAYAVTRSAAAERD